MQLQTILTQFILVCIGFTWAQTPIPLRPDGYGVGGPADAHVVIEMFFDPLCPGCQAAWPTMAQVVQAYGQRIHFRIHTFPLPYHTNSFIASQGLHVVANVTNRTLDSIYRYATRIFENQQLWYNQATQTMTIPQVIDSLATYIGKTGLVTKEQFLTGMANDDINYETRVSWKYACSRNVVGTPTFFINGVYVSADPSWTLANWKSVIDPILATNEQRSSTVTDCPAGQKECQYLPGKIQCCLLGENCIANVGCRCFNLKNGNKCT